MENDFTLCCHSSYDNAIHQTVKHDFLEGVVPLELGFLLVELGY